MRARLQVSTLPEWYVKLGRDLRTLMAVGEEHTAEAAMQSLCALLTAGGPRWLEVDAAMLSGLVDDLCRLMHGADANDRNCFGGMAAEALLHMCGYRLAWRDQVGPLKPTRGKSSVASKNSERCTGRKNRCRPGSRLCV
jgi:hypothetical protein